MHSSQKHNFWVYLLPCAMLLIGGCSGTPEDHAHDHGHSHDHHGHDHAPHHGIMTPFATGDQHIGFAELKLHDDKGDLELWLTTDEDGTTPFDLPLTTPVTLTFPQHDNKIVTLQVRNAVKNEDEDGTPTIRAGKTNYFIFPGDTGADASWLMGTSFSSDVILSLSAGGTEYKTAAFRLEPHVH